MSNGTTVLRYALHAPQIQPAASYWMYCARLRLVNIEELAAITDNQAKTTECFFPAHVPALHPTELQQLKALQIYRDNPWGLDPAVAGPNVPPRTPISRLWELAARFSHPVLQVNAGHIFDPHNRRICPAQSG